MDKMTNAQFLDKLKSQFKIKTDAQLASRLEMTRPRLSKIRNNILNVCPLVVVAVHEEFGIPVREIKRDLGQTCLPLGNR